MSAIVEFCGNTRDVDIDTAMEWLKSAENNNAIEFEENELNLEWTSPSGNVIHGFPSSCHSSDSTDDLPSCQGSNGETIFDDTTPPPCGCSGDKCVMVGDCTFTNPSGEKMSVACSEVMDQVGCEDANLLTDVCDCRCANTAFADQGNAKNSTDRCLDGYIERYVPKFNYGPIILPVYGDLKISTYSIHYRCGQGRGYLFEEKYVKALEATKKACEEYKKIQNSESSERDRIGELVSNALLVVKHAASLGSSRSHAVSMAVLLLPSALSLGPGLTLGALKSKVLVPQASTSGMFVILIPWLYAPVLWCLFNFAFQYGGNAYILPGFLLLSFTPMIYFIVGSYYQAPRPMTGKLVVRLYKVTFRLATLCSIVGFFVSLGGVIYAYYGNGTGALTWTRNKIDHLYDGKLENGEWEWRNLYTILPPIANFVHKYCFTLLVAVDFIMYTCIQQRVYELYLEEGVEGIKHFMQQEQIDKLHPYTDEEVAEMNRSRIERLNAFSKLVAAPNRAVNIDRAFRKNRKKLLFITMQSQRSLLRESSSSLGNEEKEKKKKKKKTKIKKNSDVNTSAFSKDESIHHRRVWDFINEGQPGGEYFFRNMFNNILCTPLHLKRSRSKLMEAKRMSSQREISYLSATHGLTFSRDSSLCFELLSWRRSALWVLVIFGVINLVFGCISFSELTLRRHMDSELNEQAPLNRFPIPGYVSDEVLENHNLGNPNDWTLYKAAITFRQNGTDYVLTSMPDDGNLTDRVAFVSYDMFSYEKKEHIWSLNNNGTLRNGKNGLCAEIADGSRHGKSGSMDTIRLENCVADLVGYEGVESEKLKRQTWKFIGDRKIMTTLYGSQESDNFCMGGGVMSDEKKRKLVLNQSIPMELGDCFDEERTFDFKLPERDDFQERIDSYCNNVAKRECSVMENSHITDEMTLVARYDKGKDDDEVIYTEYNDDESFDNDDADERGISGLAR